MKKLKEFLIRIKVVQKRKAKSLIFNGNVFEQTRCNPKNPLTYIVIIILFFVALIMGGLIGAWEVITFKYFEWD